MRIPHCCATVKATGFRYLSLIRSGHEQSACSRCGGSDHQVQLVREVSRIDSARARKTKCRQVRTAAGALCYRAATMPCDRAKFLRRPAHLLARRSGLPRARVPHPAAACNDRHGKESPDDRDPRSPVGHWCHCCRASIRIPDGSREIVAALSWAFCCAPVGRRALGRAFKSLKTQ